VDLNLVTETEWCPCRFTPVGSTRSRSISASCSARSSTPIDVASLSDLEARILAFQAGYQEMATSFEWMFTRKDLDELLARLASVPIAA